LPDYAVPAETIAKITARFTKRGYKVGERGEVGPEEIKLILENRL
jgi:hypothetical protein